MSTEPRIPNGPDVFAEIARRFQAFDAQITAVREQNSALEQRVSSLVEDNRSLVKQQEQRGTQLSDLTHRVSILTATNADLCDQVQRVETAAQVTERQLTVERQRIEAESSAARRTAERNSLLAEYATLEKELTALDASVKEKQVALGCTATLSGAFWGALAAGPAGAIIGGSLGGLAGGTIGEIDTEQKQIPERQRINDRMRQIRQQLATL
ncbi:MAG: hypothetical protein KGR16_04450 [Verrucomicrobia bacterium]|nr:hypothetical protein [Verrucomicrobiota bacterium]